MKRILTILVLLLPVFTLYGQDIAVSWSGVFTVRDTGMGGSLDLIMTRVED